MLGVQINFQPEPAVVIDRGQAVVHGEAVRRAGIVEIVHAIDFGQHLVALGGIIACGVVYAIIGAVVSAIGTKWIETLLPPVVTAPVVSRRARTRSLRWRVRLR